MKILFGTEIERLLAGSQKVSHKAKGGTKVTEIIIRCAHEGKPRRTEGTDNTELYSLRARGGGCIDAGFS
jgi:hypothetical protein